MPDAIRLEPFAERHLGGFAALLDDPDVGRFTRLPVPAPPGFPRVWLDRYEAGRRTGTREAFAVVDAADGFLGIALAPEIRREARAAELGYAVVPAARGRGVATAALGLLTDWALAELDPLRLELRIGVDNQASKVVAGRCGYAFEDVLPDEPVEVWSRPG